MKIYTYKSPESLEQEINDYLELFGNNNNPVNTTINIQYAIAEETVLNNNGDSKELGLLGEV
ncbi:hypothetical protein [Bacillus sp. OV322]|uniref:hypothetical protein n=1 Tax=Bacillus sp. OV322 TaxID=1882764 RepID=UPI000B85DC76|nr:hypothetical protein [Bacillus sp. OV322]